MLEIFRKKTYAFLAVYVEEAEKVEPRSPNLRLEYVTEADESEDSMVAGTPESVAQGPRATPGDVGSEVVG